MTKTSLNTKGKRRDLNVVLKKKKTLHENLYICHFSLSFPHSLKQTPCEPRDQPLSQSSSVLIIVLLYLITFPVFFHVGRCRLALITGWLGANDPTIMSTNILCYIYLSKMTTIFALAKLH